VSVTASAVLQGNPNAPVYDTSGRLCTGVKAEPPPVPDCYGYYDGCDQGTAMNGVCTLTRVVCPYCPVTMPMPPTSVPTPPTAYKDSQVPFPPPDDPFIECEYPVVPIPLAFRSGGVDIGYRQTTSVDLPVGCLDESQLPTPTDTQPNFGIFPAGWRPEFWQKLTPAERAFATTYPTVAKDFYLDSLTARAATKLIWAWKSFRDVNGPENAFQHAYWNALMAWGYGQALAKMEADAHEERPDNDPMLKCMDKFNNQIGRDVAATRIFWTREALATAVYDYCITKGNCLWLAGPGAKTCP
jgi:hypothetical protein